MDETKYVNLNTGELPKELPKDAKPIGNVRILPDANSLSGAESKEFNVKSAGEGTGFGVTVAVPKTIELAKEPLDTEPLMKGMKKKK